MVYFPVLLSLASATLAQLEHRPPSFGPWFDVATLGEQGDWGRAETLDDTQKLVDSIVDMSDVFSIAEHHLNATQYGYVTSGTLGEETKRWNVDAFEQIKFRPRSLVSVTNVTTATSLTLKNGKGEEFSFSFNSPIFFAPSGSQGRVHPDGELATVRAAAGAGVATGISGYSTYPFAEIGAAKAENQTLFYQLYPQLLSREEWLQRFEDVKAAGFSAVLITVDRAASGLRSRQKRLGITESGANRITWEDVAWLNERSPLPLIAKGIMTVEDAIRAKNVGLAGAYLSNHGGRQLDSAPAPVEVLLEIRKFRPTLIDELPIFVDGGVYSGSNAAKLLALGAKMVGIGRPVQYALTLGQPGVAKMISVLNAELAAQLALLGVNKVSELSPKYVNARRLEVNLYDGELQDDVAGL